MNTKEILQAGIDVIALMDEYHNRPHQEMLVDPVLYALLSGRFGYMQRQHCVPVYGATKPSRIDYRYGGTNPVVIEFAVRPPAGGGHLHGSQNVSELRKLCRVRITKAKLRALLLLDLSAHPLDIDDLEVTYARQTSGPGNFERNIVRVIYVHRKVTGDFRWAP
jgi:hypothetical protein